MDIKRYKNLKQLGKTRILPSVLFIIISVLVALLTFFSLILTMFVNLISERYNSLCEKAFIISYSFDSTSLQPDDLINAIVRNTEFENGLFIIDKDNNVIASSGEMTYTDEQVFIVDPRYPDTMLSKYVIFADKEIIDTLVNNNEDLSDEIINSLKNIFINRRSLQNDMTIYRLPYWVRTELSDGRTVLVKCVLTISFGDIKRVLFISSIDLLIFIILISFLFINLVLSVHHQKRMRKLIYYNPVTMGKSYVYFEHTAAKLLRSRKAKTTCCMFVDLTIMKYRSYCNYHGIHAGEELLEKIDKYICRKLDKNEICALTGKSSFVLFLQCRNREDGQKRVEQLINELSQQINHSGIAFHAGICFVDSILQQDKKQLINKEKYDPAVYFNCAGAARALLSDENVSDVAVYDVTIMDKQKWEHKVEEKMENAMKKEEFQVYIQPKYDPATEKLAGAEALVRWINEEDGFISPGKFIPIFEKNGFITKLDDYMLEHVAMLQSQWIKEGKNVVPISVNVSRAHFANPELAEHICEIVDRYDVPHELIEIELTESAFFDDRDMLLKTVHTLRELGFEISMDDFGAGYSSLNSLKDLPLDVLKLDADFFRGENAQERGEIVVSQAISLAKKLNMRIVAEGIEKKEQVDFLAEQGCDMIQGFYFAKPMPADEYAKKL